MDREEKNLESRLDLDGALSGQGTIAVKQLPTAWKYR